MQYLDYTKSFYGRRMLFEWVCAPLIDPLKIKSRQVSISDLAKHPEAIKLFHIELEKLPDLERLISTAFCEINLR